MHVIGPEKITDRAFIQQFNLTRDQWTLVQELKLGLLLIIHVRFADVFKRPYLARFLFDYDPGAAMLGHPAKGWLRTEQGYIRYK